MPRTKPWEISDELWTEIEKLIPTKEECRGADASYVRKSGGGRKRKYDDRTFFSAIVYVLRTGIIWNAIPREKFGGLSSSALHRRFQLWERGGLFSRIWEAGLLKFNELEGIDWEWQAIDGCHLYSFHKNQKRAVFPAVISATRNDGKAKFYVASGLKGASRNGICRFQSHGSGKKMGRNGAF